MGHRHRRSRSGSRRVGLRSSRVVGAAAVRSYPLRVRPLASAPTRSPNVHPRGLNVPPISDEGFEELCHLVTEEDPDTALCGKDVTGYPWNPPWPRCEACLAVTRGEMN